MAMNFPVLIVATILAFVYGLATSGTVYATIQALITFVCVLLGGLFYKGVGQIVAVVVSALIIFFAFTLPAHLRKAAEEAERERELRKALQEEDKYGAHKE